MKEYGRQHWIALKWILKYMNGSRNTGIRFTQVEEGVQDALIGYCDADYASNLDSRKSQTRYLFNLFGSIVSWKSTLQSVVALSITESEYIALTKAVKEGVWLRGMINDFGIKQNVVVVLCDSNSVICLAKIQVFHERSKHIDVRLHCTRDMIERGDVEVQKVRTEENIADALTKALPVAKFRHCLKLMNVVSDQGGVQDGAD